MIGLFGVAMLLAVLIIIKNRTPAAASSNSNPSGSTDQQPTMKAGKKYLDKVCIDCDFPNP